MAREQAVRGPAFTFLDEQGEIFAICGVLLQWPGVGAAWMCASDRLNGHGLWLTRTVRGLLDDIERVYHLHRIEAVALEESPRNQEWLEALGFTAEKDGRARGYTATGASMVRFERVREIR